MTIRIRTNIVGKAMMYWLLVAICIVLAGGCTDTYDYFTFRSLYLGQVNYSSERLFLFICDLFKSIGIDYNLFRLIVIGVSLLIVFTSFAKSVNYNPVFPLMYLLYPISYDNYNLKNTIAMAIVTIALRRIIESKNTKYLLSILLVGIAMLFHRAAIFYLFTIFVVYCFEKRWTKPLIKSGLAVIAIFTSIGILYRPLFSYAANIIIKLFFSSQEMMERSAYLQNMGRWGFVLYLFPYILMVLIAYNYYRIQITYDNSDDNFERSNPDSISGIKFLFSILSLSIVIMLIVMNTIFYRVIRNFTLMVYAYSLIGYRTYPPSKNRTWILLLVLLLVFYSFFLFTIGSFDITYKTMFTSNWILGFQ